MSKNILQLCLSPDLGGLELYMYKLCGYLNTKENLLNVINGEGRLKEKFLQSDMPFFELKRGSFLSLFSNAIKLSKIIDENNIELIHVHWTKDLPTAVLAKSVSKRKPKILQTRHMHMTRFKSDFYHRWLYKNIDLMIAVTKRVQSQIEQFIPAEIRPKVTTSYIGAAGCGKIEQDTKEQLQKSYGIKDGDFVVGIVGRIEEPKGQYLLIDAVKKLKEKRTDVLKNNTHIDNILRVNLKSVKKKKNEIFSQYKILKEYSKNGYDILIDAQGLLKSAIVSKIIGAKVVAGFDKNSIREGIASHFYDKKVHIPYDANTIDRNVTVICEPLGVKVSSEDIVNKDIFLFSSSHVENIPDVFNMFVIGSTWESRNYPKEKFVEIAEALKVPTLVVWGNEEEHQKALWMQERSEYLHILSRGSLDELKYVISKCSLLIGNDTGPTHMAWGLNVPSITIFGPTPVNRVYTTPINKVVKSKSAVNHYKLDKNDFSIREIKVEEIIRIAQQLIVDNKIKKGIA